MVRLLLQCSLGGLLGVNAKKSHVLGADERGAGNRPKLRVAGSINRVPYRP